MTFQLSHYKYHVLGHPLVFGLAPLEFSDLVQEILAQCANLLLQVLCLIDVAIATGSGFRSGFTSRRPSARNLSTSRFQPWDGLGHCSRIGFIFKPMGRNLGIFHSLEHLRIMGSHIINQCVRDPFINHH